MGKTKVIVLIAILSSVMVSAQEEAAVEKYYVRPGLITATATISPSIMLNRNQINYYVTGFWQIRFDKNLTFRGVENEVKRLAIRARDGQITVDDMTGGTFTITNGGVFGSMLSTPIINAPQVAILGMHNIVERPVVVDGQIVIRPIMYLALSYDHRIIDGRESVSFLVRLKQLLEDPARLLLDI